MIYPSVFFLFRNILAKTEMQCEFSQKGKTSLNVGKDNPYGQKWNGITIKYITNDWK